MPSLNCADGLDPCNSMAPAWGALKPRSAIATQALLTKLDRIMDFLLAQLNRCPNLSHKWAARRKTRMGPLSTFAPLKPAPGMSKSKSGPGRREGAHCGNSLSPSVAALRQNAAFIEMLRAVSKKAQLAGLVGLSCLVVIQKSRKRSNLI